ncbi:MAG TPA: CPBP family intramembrane glutamic endopeptidase [Candidatus Thermoplasmatota archaeon]|nr:CPBP family intramembrane glutamic endopeptidase [Candidatus Thermoplasmatota archaeon]
MARRSGGWAVFWDVVLVLDLVLLAIGLVVVAATTLLGRGAAEPPSFSPGVLAAEAVLSLVLLGVVPVAWALGTRRKPWEGMLLYLRLRGTWRDVGYGVLLGAAALGAGVLVGLLLQLTPEGEALLENPVLEDLLSHMSLPLAFLVAFSAAVGEEILFRGLLLRRIGLWGQAAVFGLMHLAYGTVLQVVVPAAMGVVFGLVTRRRGSIVAPIVAHFVFNFVPMALAALVPPAS